MNCEDRVNIESGAAKPGLYQRFNAEKFNRVVVTRVHAAYGIENVLSNPYGPYRYLFTTFITKAMQPMKAYVRRVV